MAGYLDKQQPWSSQRMRSSMFSPRLLSKRALVLLIAFFSFTGFVLLSSRSMSQLCENGSYCAASGLRKKLPKLGVNSILAGGIPKDRSHIAPAYKAVALDECANFPNTSSILTIMKTGASEAYSRIPAQLMTTLKCLSDFYLFSDMKQTIAGFPIHDSLDNVLENVKTNRDFELYHRQKACPVEHAECNKHFDTASQGWTLDKYKNIHMAEKVYKWRPNYDWYFFIDADTYVAYATLMEWLKHLDPAKPHYIGSVAYLGPLPFGHGGSGYLLSQAAMHAMFHGKENVGNKYDEPVQRVCCGDAMFAQALKDETGIEVVNAPVTTMHHAGVEEISDLYAFERERNFTQPLRYKDVYEKFVGSTLTEQRLDWDNMSDSIFYLNASMADYAEDELKRAKPSEGMSDLEAVAWRSFDDCKNACLSQDNCFQYLYQNYVCVFNHRLVHGRPARPEKDDSKRYKSGWNMAKITEWIKKQGDCDEPFKWPIRDRWL
ncbi:hypothetical protein E4U55_001244 [Claviceps digitariae]|nr:hypothetical protein E4U55_001244 [Claviceps digitariae]